MKKIFSVQRDQEYDDNDVEYEYEENEGNFNEAHE